MKVSCGHCSELHDVSKMEPVYKEPDCIASMLSVERIAADVLTTKDICAIRHTRRGFLRLLLPMPVHGEGRPCNWGVWVELYHYEEFLEAVGLWTNEALLKKQYAGKLANEMFSYEGSLGFAGTVRFTDVKSVGRFEPAGFPHPESSNLIRDYHQGVSVTQKLEWLLGMLHA